jgi:NADH-quinone oxidoreductase subunit A
MIDFVGHFLIFSVVAIGALIVPLLIGRLIRPKLPTPEKDAIYECGEPTIGSSYIQFDLRFYVVALLFIIFDVEVAFFFPWATIYGGAMQLADSRLTDVAREELSRKMLNLGEDSPHIASNIINSETAMSLGATGLADILVFFSVLLVGFMYVWKRGDLDWIRAVANKPTIARAPEMSPVATSSTATPAQTAS